MIKSKPQITCLSIDCPERKSVCCGAGSKTANPLERTLGVPEFYCSKCGKEFIGGKCNVEERMTKPNWVEQFDKEIYPHLLDIIDSITHGNYPPEIMHQRGDGWIDKDLKEFISNLLIQEREAGGCTCGFGKDTAAEIGHFKECPRFPEETWWQTKARIRTETIKEVIEKLNRLPTGNTPDGKHYWVSMEDLDKLMSELEKL